MTTLRPKWLPNTWNFQVKDSACMYHDRFPIYVIDTLVPGYDPKLCIRDFDFYCDSAVHENKVRQMVSKYETLKWKTQE